MKTTPAELSKTGEGRSLIEKTESGLPQQWIILKRQQNGFLLCSPREYEHWKTNGIKPQTTFVESSRLYLPSTSLAALLELGARNLDDPGFKAVQELAWTNSTPVPRYDHR